MEQVRAEEADRRRVLQLEEEERRRTGGARRRGTGAGNRGRAIARGERAPAAREEARRVLPPLVAPPAAAQLPVAAERSIRTPVLGVSRDAAPDDSRAAYEQARSKHDHDSVAHLGVDVQEHFREKALAVDRAYQMLAR